jgi:beta-1,4-mannosyl-glycoprotein beta-1,4-N-acetylglucosaminyltransferase
MRQLMRAQVDDVGGAGVGVQEVFYYNSFSVLYLKHAARLPPLLRAAATRRQRMLKPAPARQTTQHRLAVAALPLSQRVMPGTFELKCSLLLLLIASACGDHPPSVSCTALPNASPRARPVKVFDGFTFDDELDLLRVRMQMLRGVVFRFVVVEASLTHAGQPKRLVFQENRALFSEFEAQVLHVALDTLPQQPDACLPGNSSCSYSAHWQREGGQRNAIMAAVEQYCLQHATSSPASACSDDDILLVSDVDELPRPLAVQQLAHCAGFHFPVALHMRMHYYTFNSVWLDEDGNPWPWSHAKAAPLSLLRLPQHSPYALRLNSPPPRMALNNAGWHLSYFGGVATIVKKIQHLAHQENNRPEVLQESHILSCITQHADLFDREITVGATRYFLAPSDDQVLDDLPAASFPESWWRRAYLQPDEL